MKHFPKHFFAEFAITQIISCLNCRKDMAKMEVKFYNNNIKMSRAMKKRVLCHMRTTKAQISLRIRAVWSAPLLFTA